MNPLTQAKNPETSPYILQELASSSDVEIRASVAKNPNTPMDVLMKLGADFPKELLENPVFSLLQLENPNLAASMPSKTVQSLVLQQEVPQSFLESALQHLKENDLLTLAVNPQTPFLTLEKLTESKFSEVVTVAKLHVNFAGEMNQGWEEATREAILKIDFSHSFDYEDQNLLFRLVTIPEYLLPITPFHIRQIICENTTSSSILKILAQDSDDEVLEAVAENPQTPIHILETLSKDKDASVRAAVAKNLHTPIYLLEYLAKDKNYHVRRQQNLIYKLEPQNNYFVEWASLPVLHRDANYILF